MRLRKQGIPPDQARTWKNGSVRQVLWISMFRNIGCHWDPGPKIHTTYAMVLRYFASNGD